MLHSNDYEFHSSTFPFIYSINRFLFFQDFEKLPENMLMMVACLLACGVDPKKSIVFLQSEVLKQ